MLSTEEPEKSNDSAPAPKVDWIHLPANMTAGSLWDSLHDGDLVAIRSDLLARTVVLEFLIWHLNGFHGFTDDCRFSFLFADVTSVRATRWSKWPGDFEIPKGTPNAEQSRLVDEYQAKWREESDSWSSLEERLSFGKIDALDISNADLAIGPDAVSLRLETQSEDQGFQVLTIAAKGLRICRTGNIEVNLEAFVRLGEDYWTAFANRST